MLPDGHLNLPNTKQMKKEVVLIKIWQTFEKQKTKNKNKNIDFEIIFSKRFASKTTGYTFGEYSCTIYTNETKILSFILRNLFIAFLILFAGIALSNVQ